MIKTIVYYPYHFSRHCSHVVAGVLRYAAANDVPVKLASIREFPLREELGVEGIFVDLAMADGGRRRLCFDMADYPGIAEEGGLNHCDIYVKRSYSASIVESMPIHYRERIIPYGLYFACSQERRYAELKVFLRSWQNSSNERLVDFFRNGRVVVKWLARALFTNAAAFTDLSQLESIQGGENIVFYHTRLWEPESHRSYASRSIEELNAMRIDIGRTLKAELGNRFVGGVLPSDYARKVCSDIISPHASDTASYLKLLARAKIVVTEEGLHGSSGSRLGEFFAAGRCIVSEPLRYAVPHMPNDGTHWHTYETPEECVAICARLLRDAQAVDATMNNARHLYEQALSPQATWNLVLQRCLRTA